MLQEWERGTAFSSQQNVFIWIEVFDDKYVQYL